MLEMKPERFSVHELTTQEISLCGRHLIADVSGAIYWPTERALLVSDLHLEKGSAFAERGQMLPPYDTRETLQRLAEVIDRFQTDTVIALGDSLHDKGAIDRISEEDLQTLRIFQDHCEWIWVAGNHDPEIPDILGGHARTQITVEGITLKHEPTHGAATHEIAGHLHPAAKISRHGHSVRRPCFVGNGTRLVMPAFGAYTGGLNILDDAFLPLFGNQGMAVWMLGHEGLYPIATRLLIAD